MGVTPRHAKGLFVLNGTGLDLVTDTVFEGDVIHVAGHWLHTNDTFAVTRTLAVSDSAGHTWIPHTVRTKSGTGFDRARAQSWHTVVVTPGVLTIHLALTGGAVQQLIGEYAALIDAHQTTPHLGEEWGQSIGSAATSLSTGNVIVTSEGAMLLSSIATSNNRTFNMPSGGWAQATVTNTEDGGAAACAFLALTAADTWSVAWSWSGGSSNGVALIDAYRAAPPAGPTYTGTYNLIARNGGLDDGL